jgi:uncharacterized protein YegL
VSAADDYGVFAPATARRTFDDQAVSAGSVPVVPVCLLIDASWSIERDGRTAELNDALARWPERIASRPELEGVEIAVVVFGPNHRAVPLHLDPEHPTDAFVEPEKVRLPPLVPDGTTPLGIALQVGLDLCTRRSEQLRGRAQRRLPTLAVISDGRPTDANGDPDLHAWRTAAQRVRAAVDKKQLRAFAVALEGADVEVLESFADPVVRSDQPIDEILEVVTYASAYGDRKDMVHDYFDGLRRPRTNA